MISLKIYRSNLNVNVHVIFQFQGDFPNRLRGNFAARHFGWEVVSSVCPSIELEERKLWLPGSDPDRDLRFVIEHFPSLPHAFDYMEAVIQLIRAVNRDLAVNRDVWPYYTPSISPVTAPFVNTTNYPVCFLVS